MSLNWFTLLVSLVIFLFFAFCTIKLTLIVVTVKNHSMSPTLKDGDRVLVFRYWPHWWLKKGQIVLVWPWNKLKNTKKPFGDNDPFIKRIIGLPGDTLITSLAELDDFNQVREAVNHDKNGQRFWNILPKHIFVRGDHPIGGFDSLSWGPILRQKVLGVVIMRLPGRLNSPTLANTIKSGANDFEEQPSTGPKPKLLSPSFDALSLTGDAVTLQTYAGSPIALLIIRPNQRLHKEQPDYNLLKAKVIASGFELILLSIADATQTRHFAEQNRLDLPVLTTANYAAFIKDFNITGVPTYCLINEKGTIVQAGFPGQEWGKFHPL